MQIPPNLNDLLNELKYHCGNTLACPEFPAVLHIMNNYSYSYVFNINIISCKILRHFSSILFEIKIVIKDAFFPIPQEKCNWFSSYVGNV